MKAKDPDLEEMNGAPLALQAEGPCGSGAYQHLHGGLGETLPCLMPWRAAASWGPQPRVQGTH